MIVRKRVNPSGNIVWQLDFGMVEGKHLRRSFDTREEAEEQMAAARGRRRELGTSGLAALTSREVAAFAVASDQLAQAGATVQDAVHFFLSHAKHVRERVLVPDLVERFIEAKKKSGRSLRTLQTMRVTLRSLARAFPRRPVHELTRAEIEGWLHGNAWGARTINNRAAEVRTLFAWAIKENLAALNPAGGIAKQREPLEEIATLSLSECRRLLKAVAGTRLAAYAVLGLFCGLRRSELERLRWDAVDLKGRTVIVAAASTKTRRRRVVDIPPNAIAWLRGLKRPRGKRICPANFRDDWIELRQVSGFADWPHNALRHTFASYHYAHHQNEPLLRAQMGTGEKMLHAHYRALKTRAEAAKFWKLRPRR